MRSVLLLLGLLAIATGCGATSATNPDVNEVADASASDSSRMAISYGGTVYFAGEWDFQKNVGSFTSSPSDEHSWNQIVTADATYTRLDARVFGGLTKSWVKWELRDDSEDGSANAFKHSFFGFAPSDPAELLALLKAASSVHEVGSGEERGVAVKRYRAELDVERALQTQPKDEREIVRAMFRQYELGTNGQIPLDLAVDDGGRLRRVDVDVPDGDQLSVEFFDYGIAVTAKPPPAGDVLSREEWARLMPQLSERCSRNADDADDELTLCVGKDRLGTSMPEETK